MSILENDLNRILSSNVDFCELSGKSILITGGTGLIGYNLIQTLIAANNEVSEPIVIFAVVRSLDKARKLFGINYDKIRFIVGDVTEKINVDEPIDYIVHAASQTSSKAFVDEPVETIQVALNGTLNMLELAKENNVSKFLYLSSMEVYGAPSTDEKIDENHNCDINTMAVRSCYPESKRMCENLCTAYNKEYNVPIAVVRLTQTFGLGVSYNDGRVFAEFARCVIENKDIVLHTKGETKRNYLYTADAVTAILTVLLKGKPGEAYNAANKDTYCSIYEMAQMVAKECAKDQIAVKIEIEDESKFGFAPVLKMNLDTAKLSNLGWHAETGLKEMYDILISSMMEQEFEN